MSSSYSSNSSSFLEDNELFTKTQINSPVKLVGKQIDEFVRLNHNIIRPRAMKAGSIQSNNRELRPPPGFQLPGSMSSVSSRSAQRKSILPPRRVLQVKTEWDSKNLDKLLIPYSNLKLETGQIDNEDPIIDDLDLDQSKTIPLVMETPRIANQVAQIQLNSVKTTSFCMTFENVKVGFKLSEARNDGFISLGKSFKAQRLLSLYFEDRMSAFDINRRLFLRQKVYLTKELWEIQLDNPNLLDLLKTLELCPFCQTRTLVGKLICGTCINNPGMLDI